MALVKMLAIFAVVLLAKTVSSGPTFQPVAPPAPWFPNRYPESFQSGEKTTLYTSMIEEATFLTEDRTDFRFTVKACSDAIIKFIGLTVGDKEDQLSVELGTNGNKETQIKHGQDVIATLGTPDLLHCHEFRAFWISWRTAYFQVGRGPVIGRNHLIGTDEITSSQFTISLSLSSGVKTSSAVWTVTENSADELQVSGVAEVGYDQVWRDVNKRNFISFHVTACADAKILLTSQYGGIQDKVYEIILGAKKNTYVVVRTQVGGGEVLEEKYTGALLNCLEQRDFWISWFNHGSQFGTLKVGRGLKYGKNIIVDVTDTELPVDVRHLAVTSAATEIVTWGFEEDIEDVTMVTTQNPAGDTDPEIRYKYVWLESVQSKFMTFFVSSCDQVSIHISTTDEIDEEFGVELVIGGDNNTRSYLHPIIGEGDLASADTPDILHCQHTRYFWMSWKDGFIRFGKGRSSESQLVLQATAPAETYYGVALSSRSNEALWAIKTRYSENLQLIDSTDLVNPLEVWRTVKTKKEVTFQVKSCSDATVYLSPFPGSDSTSFYFRVRLNAEKTNLTIIDLVVGDGTKIKELAKKEVPDVLSCTAYREFYISWWAGRIQVGRGRYQGRLLSAFLEADYTSTAHHVQAVAFHSVQEINAEWSIRGDVGDMFIYHTPKEGDYQTWITLLPNANYFSFDVTAESDAHLILLENIINQDGQKVEVVISGWDNTMSVIRDVGPPGKVYQRYNNSKGLLEGSSSRTFWVSWDNVTGNIQVGGGNPLLEGGMFMNWVNPKPFSVTALGIKTSGGYDGRWYVRQHMGHTTWFPTHIPILPINVEETWRSVEHTRSIFFKVKAFAEVTLSLAQHSGITKQDALSLVIGGDNNTVTYIRTAEGGDIYLKVDTPNILDPQNERDFWVSWNDGEVQFGKGNIAGDARVLTFQVIPVLNIRAVRFSTTYGQEGLWMVQMWNGNGEPRPNLKQHRQ